MFAKMFALFALLAVVAFAAPNPKPQLITYSSGLDYVYPGSPSYISPVSYEYSAPVAPVAYSALPSGAVYFH